MGSRKKDKGPIPNTFTFERLENILYKQAHKICRKFPNERYELDELVNEVWVKGDIQRVKDIRFVAGRAYFDMIDYIKKAEGRDFTEDGVLKKRFKEITNRHEMKGEKESNDKDFFETIMTTHKSDIEFFEEKELAQDALNFLPTNMKMIMRYYFFHDLTLKQVGKIFSISETRTYQIVKNSLIKIRENHPYFEEYKIVCSTKKYKKKQKKQIPIVDILPEYVSDYEIDNESALQEDFVLERDWK